MRGAATTDRALEDRHVGGCCPLAEDVGRYFGRHLCGMGGVNSKKKKGVTGGIPQQRALLTKSGWADLSCVLLVLQVMNAEEPR